MSAPADCGEFGFTLAELLIAVTLFVLVFAAILAFCSSSFRSSADLVAEGLVQSDLRMLEHALSKASGNATFVESPSTGTLSVSELCLWENVSSDDGTSALTAGARRFSRFCRTGGGQVFLHQGGFPRPSFACGSPAPGVDVTALVGGDSAQVSAALVFQRPAGESNVVLVDYQLYLPARAARRGVAVQGSLQLNIQGAIDLP